MHHALLFPKYFSCCFCNTVDHISLKSQQQSFRLVAGPQLFQMIKVLQFYLIEQRQRSVLEALTCKARLTDTFEAMNKVNTRGTVQTGR